MNQSNEIFLNTIQEKTHYKRSISSSFQELKKWNSLIFRRGRYWYQFDNWSIPNTGVIKEWYVEDNDWIPKVSSSSLDNSNSLKIVFDVEKYTLPDDSILQDVRISSDESYIVLVVSSLRSTNLIGIKKYTMEELFIIEDISVESSFYLGKFGVMYTRFKEYGRPSKLFYKSFDSFTEEELFEENECSFRLKIVHIDSNNCFVKSVDFQKGRIFLYSFDRTGFVRHSYTETVAPTPRDIALFSTEKAQYFLGLSSTEEKKDQLILRETSSGDRVSITIPYQDRARRVHCIGRYILLDCSNAANSVFYLATFKNNSLRELSVNKITFDEKTTLYENSFSDRVLLFLERRTFYEKILSFDLIENTLKTEFERPIIKSNNTKYFSKVIWTKKDSYDVSIPISLFWKSEDTDELPRRKKCILSVYGAYGKNDNSDLDEIMLSIIDAGFIYAIVHVRGGGYLGGEWYRSGKALNKWNSIRDFIEGVNYLRENDVIDSKRLGLITSSAGGIIAGAVLNEEKNLLQSILLFSPFINPYDTLQNPNDPLSKTEIAEWGDIRDPEVKAYIKSYSPMQNIEKARDSNTVIVNILGEKDPYINNNEVIEWSKKLNSIGVKSLLYLNKAASHGGFTPSDVLLMIDTLNYFFEEVGRNNL
ncbi:prolyl oligopeptidase family serine peptidase [Streptococcus pneumoniae]|uniref:prolyl oligopeptidase family serine peptidase n=1 Tax=Streptococcus pneumoniae TaxID=1313 RepID=UPI0007667F98|nr:prolyl oligopeptidase family serine peptidase [Streptococcus pneumoniae]MDA2868585.1 prolyl oligopeptidase family serine peptidase [Streptococcus pneumoniae]MDS2229068.1 prolyl oligopeptidase family serine peptidase [Streptococcus pneumoniae]MDS2236140.1 prolyl oligopeptidase family serine peptidase [Streptococcus pneumoniae]MDS2326893.1 prolyl oligopeptidase family serine peptidase [Streptococcus pneumoniae]MDS2456769.1 prolyl oligopeptidase family serine peptidase [Streptococcus pneumonia